jgi:hypothetical protein
MTETGSERPNTVAIKKVERGPDMAGERLR